MSDLVKLTSQPLSLDVISRSVAHDHYGAISYFVGVVRNHNLGRQVSGVSYEAFAPLCLQTFHEIIAEAETRFGAVHTGIHHRTGLVVVGEASVMVAAASVHRAESLHAVKFAIDALKHRAPIWKLEHYLDGDSGWVPGHSLCQAEHLRKEM